MHRSVLLVLVVALAARVFTTSFGAATGQERSRTQPEHLPLRSAQIGASKPRTQTYYDAPGEPVAPSHGGGQGFKSPRVHS